MSGMLMGFIIAYCVGIFLQVALGALFLIEAQGWSRAQDEKRGARLILASPIWPATVLPLIPRGFASLIRMADLERKRQ